MKKFKTKKFVAVAMASAMVVSMVGCGDKTNEEQTPTNAPTTTGEEGTTPAPSTGDTTNPSGGDNTQTGGDNAEVPTYTLNTYSSALGNNWNPHTWEVNADDAVLSYITSPFCTMSILDSENGVYQWVYEMATSIEDVTKDHKDDLTKYNVTFAEGKDASNTESGYVFEIKLNPDACWQDGTKINADSYIYSMQQLLNPEMKNYRANLYYSGESAVAGGADYYWAGSLVKVENTSAGFQYADLVLGDDGVYTAPDGSPLYIAVSAPLTEWLQGDTLADYVDAYGAAYFDVDAFEALRAQADEDGYAPATEENMNNLIGTITAVEAWGETAENSAAYLYYDKEYPECTYDKVGCYKVDDYTIRYVTQNYIDFNYFLTSCTSTWLVYEPFYEAGKDTTGSIVTTDYGTKIENTMSYGPYKLVSLQNDKQMIFEKNENWYGYKEENGRLVSYTNFLVDGESVEQYITDKVIINVMDDNAAKQAFLKGEVDAWSPSADDLSTYATSDQLYKVDETYTMSFFFNTNVEKLQEMDKSKGNTNSVVISNDNFRKAFSLGIDRTEWVTATPGYKPAYAIMNNLYFYDVYNDPTSSYRNSDEAMQAICNLYGVKYGDGTPYATLKDAYKSINGYNLTEAKELMKKACDELVAAGLYNAGEDIVIRIGYKKGALDSSDNKQVELMNKYINAAAEGSGFGKITLTAIDNINDRYGDTAKGEYAIGYGAWGGAAFYPFRNFQVYCDPDQYSIQEAGCWDPTSETLTLTVNGVEETMTWQAWSGALIGTGKYSEADFKTKLSITAQLEENFLKKYYRIPLAGTTACEMLSYKLSYYTEDYNIMYDFGGLRLYRYNYSDKEWADFVAEQGGNLSYE